MIRRPPRSTRTDPLFPYRRSSDLQRRLAAVDGSKALGQLVAQGREGVDRPVMLARHVLQGEVALLDGLDTVGVELHGAGKGIELGQGLLGLEARALQRLEGRGERLAGSGRDALQRAQGAAEPI